MAEQTCPRCRLVVLNFTRKRYGAQTAWCWVCGRGYYLDNGNIRDISIRCSKILKVVPVYFCQTCPESEECFREALKAKPKLTEQPKFEVRGEGRIIHA